MKLRMIASTILISGLQSFAAADADNSRTNKRDRMQGELTADQQSYKSSDTKIVRRIRQDIMKQRDFSTYAKNIKVIAINGMITLKGPVRTDEEINSILKYARLAAGESNVKNEMSVVKGTK